MAQVAALQQVIAETQAAAPLSSEVSAATAAKTGPTHAAQTSGTAMAASLAPEADATAAETGAAHAAQAAGMARGRSLHVDSQGTLRRRS